MLSGKEFQAAGPACTTEATFTEFSSSGTFDVVGGVGGPQTGSTTGFND